MDRMTRRRLCYEALTKQERANSSEKGHTQCVHVGPLDERHGSSDGGVLTTSRSKLTSSHLSWRSDGEVVDVPE
jgi:hypothetical protein